MKFGRGCGRGQTELDLRDPHAMPVTPERFPWLSKFDGQLIAGVRPPWAEYASALSNSHASESASYAPLRTHAAARRLVAGARE